MTLARSSEKAFTVAGVRAMWIFTEIADKFDQVRKESGATLDSWLEPWVASTLEDDSPWYRNAAVYTGAGLAYGSYHLSTQVASGLLDTLRLGDGVKEGGWGYGQDALRLLVVAGPAVRVARMGLSRVVALDALPHLGNCTWVAAFRDALGRLRILDRSGRVVSNLDELKALYPGIEGATVYGPAATVLNSHVVNGLEQLIPAAKALLPASPPGYTPPLTDRIVLEVRSVPVRPAKPPASIPGVYTQTTSQHCAPSMSEGSYGSMVCTQQTQRSYRVGTGDTLSKIAQRVYGNPSAWEKIYQANKTLIGANPHLLRAGILLYIP